MSGEFERDDKWQRGAREMFLRPFYARHFSSFEFVDGDVDTIAVGRKTGKTYRIEEKLQRAPRRLERFGNYPLETMSCSVPGRERDGWMATSTADLLLFGFCNVGETTLDVHVLDMPALKAWFWPRVDMFRRCVNPQLNQSVAYMVPFGIVPREIRLYRTLLWTPEACTGSNFVP